jgi:lysophospholipase L1-like esterase
MLKRLTSPLVILLTLGLWFGVLEASGTPALRTEATQSTAQAAAVNYGSGLWAGPSATITRFGNPGTASVLIVGDSITAGCYPALNALLVAKGKTLAVIAQSGQNTAGLATLLEAVPVLPERVILAAGANDVFQPPLFSAAFKRMVAKVDGRKWFAVDTYVGRAGTVQPHDIRNSGWVNGQLHAVAGPDHVISANAALGAAVGRGRPLSYYLRDGVHYWPSAGTGHGNGCAFWAAVVAAGAGL